MADIPKKSRILSIFTAGVIREISSLLLQLN